MTDDKTFADFLSQKKANNYNITDAVEKTVPARLTSDKNASIDDYIEMLSMVCGKVMKKMKVAFQPDEGARMKSDMLEPVDHPYIFFKIISCNPVQEIKPRIRQDCVEMEIEDDEEELKRPRDIWGQQFRYVIQFDIFADGYKDATEVMKTFEDVVFSYTAYFKRQGVKDIRFMRRLTDSNLDTYRQKCSIRSLQYEVDIEKLFTRFETTIGDISVR